MYSSSWLAKLYVSTHVLSNITNCKFRITILHLSDDENQANMSVVWVMFVTNASIICICLFNDIFTRLTGVKINTAMDVYNSNGGTPYGNLTIIATGDVNGKMEITFDNIPFGSFITKLIDNTIDPINGKDTGNMNC